MLLTGLLLSLCGQIQPDATGARLVGDDAPIEILLTPYPSVRQLEAELAELTRLRVSIRLPVTLLVIGATSTLIGTGILLSAIITSRLFALPLGILGLVAVGLGMPLGILAIWMLADRVEQRLRRNAAANELREQLEQVRRQRSGLGPPSLTTVATF